MAYHISDPYQAFGLVQDVKVERTRGSTAAKENRRSSANTAGAAAEPGEGGKAASGVSAMRAFWETAGQKAEKPRAGAAPLCAGTDKEHTGTQKIMCHEDSRTVGGNGQHMCVLECVSLTEDVTVLPSKIVYQMWTALMTLRRLSLHRNIAKPQYVGIDRRRLAAAGAQGLPHQGAGAKGKAAGTQQPAKKALQDWSDDD